MTTSEHKGSKHSARAMPSVARGVSFADGTLVVDLEDGRQISVPIAWFPRLAAAMHSRELDNWWLIGEGIGIHWPDLDEDISVENLLANRAELLTYHDVPSDVDGQHRRQVKVIPSCVTHQQSRCDTRTARPQNGPLPIRLLAEVWSRANEVVEFGAARTGLERASIASW